jgi:hypothetical protein
MTLDWGCALAGIGERSFAFEVLPISFSTYGGE